MKQLTGCQTKLLQTELRIKVTSVIKHQATGYDDYDKTFILPLYPWKPSSQVHKNKRVTQFHNRISLQMEKLFSTDLTLREREFLGIGAATEKALIPVLVPTFGTKAELAVFLTKTELAVWVFLQE